MKWIVGLGNPGKQYEQTRHNVGFMVIDQLAQMWGTTVRQEKCKSLIGEAHVRGQKVYLIKPQTYMNLSGEAMRAFADFYKADLNDMILIYDDLDTAFGQIRLRYQGSAGGHNGLKSLIAHFQTQSFARVRVGIDRPLPGWKTADYVLAPFPKQDADALAQVIQKAKYAVDDALDQPFERVMAKYNQ